MNLAARMGRLGTETAFEVLARAKQLEAEGRSIVHLEIGEPDFDTPRNIIDAGISALNEGFTHYNPSPGIRSCGRPSRGRSAARAASRSSPRRSWSCRAASPSCSS
jgi:aspartate/methionine/tyrosine aminotransferase